MDFQSKLAPWDISPYFRTPVEETFSVGMTPVQVAKGDPMRWAILFSCPSSFNQARISTLPNVAATGGVSIGSNSQGPTILTFDLYGPMVQQAWYAFGGAAAFVTVITQSMTQWPGAVPAGMDNMIVRADRGDFKAPYNIYKAPPPRSRLYGYRWNPR